MLERLDYVKIAPRFILDAGSGPAREARALRKRYRDARIVALDFSLPLLPRHDFLDRLLGRAVSRPLCADLLKLPIGAAAVDLVWSNMALHWIAEPLEALAENLKEVRPTVFFGVPRVWEKFRDGIASKLGEATGPKAKIAAWAQNVGRRVVAVRNRGGKPGGMLAVQGAIAAKLVHHKVAHAVGMDQVKAAVTAAAPISVDVLEFFAGFGMSVIEVYGQSEGSGPSTANRPGATKFGSVGTAYPGTEVRIAADGEVLLKGGNVFAGYYKNPEATAETLIDGWLHSGDIGEFDRDQFLTITGRKKDIIITAGGKNIAPKDLETGIKDNPLVSEAVLIGDRRKYLTALVTLDPVAAGTYADRHNLTGPLHLSPEIRREIQATIDGINKKVSQVNGVKKFSILPRELSIENGELTGTLKVKRNRVTEHFAAEIEALYAAD